MATHLLFSNSFYDKDTRNLSSIFFVVILCVEKVAPKILKICGAKVCRELLKPNYDNNMELLTPIQKEKFLSISGFEYTTNERQGQFVTPFPYNNREWNLSPWHFSYIIEETTGNLICELAHRMTNNRIYGWDRLGNELPDSVLQKYFTEYF